MADYPLMAAAEDAAAKAHADANIREHPGLLLDVFVPCSNGGTQGTAQKDQHDHLDAVAKAIGRFGASTRPLLDRWDELADGLGTPPGDRWQQKTVWRLAMHLGRSTALENASLCLHPIYGFPYLPGSGLKGLASTYAELQVGQSADWKRIFGTTAHGGAVTFLDAWPASWPKVEVDITNSHHRQYYSEKGKLPPGDWESPVPVYFLTVAADQPFRFAVAKSRPGTEDGDMTLAKEWLQEGLKELGFGAKTAAGYGYFGEPSEDVPAGAPQPPADPIDQFSQWLQQRMAGGMQAQHIGGIEQQIRGLPADRRAAAAAVCLGLLEGDAVLDESFRGGNTFRGRIEAFLQE